MIEEKLPYDKQIFVCTNDAKGEKASCGDHQGEAIFRSLREAAKERGLHPRIRVAQAKCLGKCNMGCNIMVSSKIGKVNDEVWFHHVSVDDVPTLIERYLSV